MSSGDSLPRMIEAAIRDVNKDEAVMSVLKKLILLNESGALDALIELLMTIKNILNIVNDDMVDNAASIIRDLVLLMDNVINSPLIKLLSESVNDKEVDEAILNIKGSKVTIVDIIRLSRDKDVINGLYLLLTVMKVLGSKVRNYDAR